MRPVGLLLTFFPFRVVRCPLLAARAAGMVATAGYVIGEVGAEGPSGTWEDLVRARIFRPLGMSRTCANYSECAHKDNRATPMTFDHHENKSDGSRTHTLTRPHARGVRAW